MGRVCIFMDLEFSDRKPKKAGSIENLTLTGPRVTGTLCKPNFRAVTSIIF